MDAVKDILKEELNYALELKKFYKENMRNLPKGSISKKKIKNRQYYYLQYRKAGKVKCDFLSKLSADEVKEIEEKVEKKKKYIKLLKQVEEKIIYLKKALSVKV